MVEPGIAVNVMGTTDVVFGCVDQPRFDPDRRLVLNRFPAGKAWCVGGPMASTGGAVAWLAGLLGADLRTLTAEAATIAAGSDDLIFSPVLAGSRTPRWDGTERGGVTRLGFEHGRGHLFRAALEGIAVEVAEVFDALEAAVTPRTRMLLYTSPSNPLGWLATVDEQRKLLEFTRRHNLWLMADEVYERLNYTGAKPTTPAPSILKLATRDDAVVVVQSFSKMYCMTGWRLGWLISRRDLCARATQLNEFIISHAPSFSQRAAETALLWGENALGEMLVRLRENRDFCLAAMAKMPRVTVPKPDGAFYLFPKIAGMSDSFDFCKRLLMDTHVGLAPGVAFGNGGEGSVRICYAAEKQIVQEGMGRLAMFLK